jgi:hypothetical protein
MAIMMKKNIRHILFVLICFFFVSACSEEDNAGTSVTDIEVVGPYVTSYGYIPRITHESVLVIEQDYGGTVYNEATDQELYFETIESERCVDWVVVYFGPDICRKWGPITYSIYEIPLSVGENRIYIGFTKAVNTTTVEPSIIIERVSLSPTEVTHNDNCENPYPLYGPTLLMGNISDHYICFLFEADIDKIYTILAPLEGELYFNIADINFNYLVHGDTHSWDDEFQHFSEIQLDAGQQIYIQVQSSHSFELGIY